MSSTVEVLQAEVLNLSKADRSRLLERLIASLDVDADAEAEWEQLAAHRDTELESGAVTGVPLEDAMAQLRARFAGVIGTHTFTTCHRGPCSGVAIWLGGRGLLRSRAG